VAEIFRVLRVEKMFCGGSAFLLGVLRFLVCFVVVNRGEVVVDCVVNVVCWLPLFRRLKVGQLFQLYFGWVLWCRDRPA
jgi:hypothetical protein